LVSLALLPILYTVGVILIFIWLSSQLLVLLLDGYGGVLQGHEMEINLWMQQ
jgi:hypothetical protein